jgi:hypothetical protein
VPTAPTSVHAPSWPTALTVLGGFAACGLALTVLYDTAGLGLPCPFQTLTGWECPLCGTTRLAASLLHGDLAAAFGHNPAVLVALVVLTLLGVLRMLEVLGGPAVRPPGWVRAAAARLGPVGWLLVGLGAAVLDVLVRHLL